MVFIKTIGNTKATEALLVITDASKFVNKNIPASIPTIPRGFRKLNVDCANDSANPVFTIAVPKAKLSAITNTRLKSIPLAISRGEAIPTKLSITMRNNSEVNNGTKPIPASMIAEKSPMINT